MGIRQRTGIRQCTGIRQRAGIRRCAHRQQLVNIAGERMKSLARTSAAERSVSKKCELLKEDCLSHEGEAWVYDNARVFGDARVSGNAWVFGNARVYDNARVSGNARRC